MKNEILQALGDWNPWLSGGKFPTELRGFVRDYDIFSYSQIEEIKILEGARRVGKSTLFYQVIEQLLEEKHKVLYVNFDDEELRKYPLKAIMQTYLEKGGVDCLFLDEIQHCVEWEHYVRNLYDRKEVKQIWISGSNASLIKQDYKTLLSGRNITLQIHPLSFKEYLRFKNCEIPELRSRQKEIEIKNHFENYLKFGAFPAIALRNVYQKELLINYFEDFIFKDIASRHSVDNAKLKDLGIYLATNATKLFSYRKVAQSLSAHPNTIMDYISYYKEIFLFNELYKFDFSLQRQFSSHKKIYAIDTGIAAAVSFRFSSERGRMLENLVYNELQRRKHELFFFKEEKECDFLIKENLEIIQAIQVCATLSEPETKQREMAGVLAALEAHPHAKALILTEDESGEEPVTIGKRRHRIKILPIWEWLL